MNINLKEKNFAVVKKIPRGGTLSYKQVSRLAGKLLVYRAVGNILHTNYDPAIPCHRVIRSDGRTVGYNRGAQRNKELLGMEKVSKKV